MLELSEMCFISIWMCLCVCVWQFFSFWQEPVVSFFVIWNLMSFIFVLVRFCICFVGKQNWKQKSIVCVTKLTLRFSLWRAIGTWTCVVFVLRNTFYLSDTFHNFHSKLRTESFVKFLNKFSRIKNLTQAIVYWNCRFLNGNKIKGMWVAMKLFGTFLKALEQGA